MPAPLLIASNGFRTPTDIDRETASTDLDELFADLTREELRLEQAA